MATTSLPSPRRRISARVVPVLLAAVLLLAGCSGGGDDDAPGKSGPNGKQAGPSGGSAKAPDGPTFQMSPANGATSVAPASKVTVSLNKSKLTAVQVKSASGDLVDGKVAADGKSWTSSGKLSFSAKYTVQATSDGQQPVSVGSFSTVPTSSISSVRASSTLGDGRTYGVAMPVILRLDRALSGSAQKAAFEKALTVTSQPATSGAWGWVNNREVHFRPKTYWASGSKVHVDVDTAGKQFGDGVWGRTDLTIDFSIGTKREMIIENKTKQMTVLENGANVRTIPVSLGRTKYPSSSGTMVVIDKRPEAMFDSSTYGLAVDSPDGYRTKVQFPIRLTWGGEFIHSAPWSVAQQGKTNTSHGCANVSPANAKWLYDRVRTGDPVTVRNTEVRVKAGDGWTDWSVTYADWLDRSAAGDRPTG